MKRLVRAEQSESGMAMIAAIIAMMVAAGAIAIIAMAVTTSGEQSKLDTKRLQSLGWAQTAAANLEYGLKSHQIGRNVNGSEQLKGSPYKADRNWILAIPISNGKEVTGKLTTAVTRSVNGVPLKENVAQFSSGATGISGYYNVLPPRDAKGMPIGSVPGGLLHTDMSNPKRLGGVDFWVQGTEAGNERPVTVKLSFRRSSFTRFTIISDQKIELEPGSYVNDNRFGALVPNPPFACMSSFKGLAVGAAMCPRIHSNGVSRNSGDLSVKLNSDIWNVSTSASTGRVSNGGPNACANNWVQSLYCKSNTNELVDFGAIDNAFEEVHRLALRQPAGDRNRCWRGTGKVTTPHYPQAAACEVFYDSTNLGLDKPLAGSYSLMWQVRLDYDRVRFRPIYVWSRRDQAGWARPRQDNKNDLYWGDGWGTGNLPDDTKAWLPDSDTFFHPIRADCSGGVMCYTWPRSNFTVTFDPPWQYTSDATLPIVRRISSASSWNGISDSQDWATYTPPPGGGALLFRSDVVVSGQMVDTPVTIMARMARNVGRPASIYLAPEDGEQTLGGAWAKDGAGNLIRDTKVGLVAEGNIYIPAWVMRLRLQDRRLIVQNTALVAKNGTVAIGSTMSSLRNSIKVCKAVRDKNVGTDNRRDDFLNGISVGTPSRAIQINGSIAVQEPPQLIFRGDDCQVGFLNRMYNNMPGMSYDPPPFMPADKPWALSAWNEVL